MKTLFAAFALLLFASAAAAQIAQPVHHPLLSLSRLSVAAGAGLEYYGSSVTEGPGEFQHEWASGIHAAYNVYGPPGDLGRTSLVGSGVYLLSSRELRYSLGVRITLFQGR